MDKSLIKEEVDRCLTTLREGGIILYPTDTLWGIGCDATNADAVKRIYRLKERQESKSMLILLDSIDKVSLYVDDTPHVAWDLLEMADKPLTLILPKAKKIAVNLVAPDGSIGIRVPQHEFCRELIRRLGRPLVSTSANVSGDKTPSSFQEIDSCIKEGVDYVVPTSFEGAMTRKPSSIIQLSISSEVTILRP